MTTNTFGQNEQDRNINRAEQESEQEYEEESGSDDAEFEVHLELEMPAEAIPRLKELEKETHRLYLAQQLDEKLETALQA